MSIHRRLVLVNGLVLLVATLVLVLSPATVSYPVSVTEALVMVLGVAAMVGVNGLVVASVLGPLRRLRRAVEHLDTPRAVDPVPVAQDDEVGAITRAFNDMVVRLEEERRRSSSLVIASQEGERQRVARDLHDGVGQTMTVVLLQLTALEKVVDEDVRAEVAETTEVARAALEEVREVSRRLRPGALADLGLVPALKPLVRDLAASSGVDITMTADRVDDLDADTQLVVYRVVQEALTNVVRHAGATRATVGISRDAAGLRVVVTDDGSGVDGPPGTGLTGMRERALLVRGDLRVSSAPGGGTTVTLLVPRTQPTEETRR